MSEIPYVNQLGDAFDEAIAHGARARRRRPRLGRRRYLAVALAALAVGGGGAAVAGLFTDPVEIGFGNVACYEGTEPSGNVAIISDPTMAPAQLCATSLSSRGFEAHDLIACQWPGHGVVVVVRGDRGRCTSRGLAPVPPSYARARRRAVRLETLAMEFERGAGCLAPARVRAASDGGAPQWRVAALAGGRGRWSRSVRPRLGPERVQLLGSIGSSVDATRRTIAIKGRASIELEQVIYGADSPGVRLFDSSGERCFTLAALEKHVRSSARPGEGPDPLPARVDAREHGCRGATRRPLRRGLRDLRRRPPGLCRRPDRDRRGALAAGRRGLSLSTRCARAARRGVPPRRRPPPRTAGRLARSPAARGARPSADPSSSRAA